MIYHIMQKETWKNAVQDGYYEAESLAKEGFIHAAKIEQVAGVIDRYFKNKQDLLALHIDEHKLTAPFTYVFSASVDDEFPHIFGKLNVDAVLKVEEL